MIDVQALLVNVLTSPNNRKLLDEVRQHAEEILQHLDQVESLADWEKHVSTGDPAWLAEVLSAIAGDAELSPEDARVLDAVFAVNVRSESAVGYAFKEGLLPGLPEDLADLGHRLQRIPEIDMNDRKHLLETPAVQAGMPPAASLVPFGVTPLTVFYATEAVSGLSQRIVRREKLSDDTALIFDPSQSPSATALGYVVSNDLILIEIEHMAECTRPVARILYPWLVEVAQFKPFVFRQFAASPCERAVSLSPTSADDMDLYVRWGLPAEASTCAAV